MKKLTLLTIALLCLLPIFGKAQERIRNDQKSPYNAHEWTSTVVYSKINYTTSLNDTTGWIDIEPYREISFNVYSTDSASVDIYFQSRNSLLPNTLQLTTYADSLTNPIDLYSETANDGLRRGVLIKTTTLNRLNQPYNNQVRIVVDHRAAGAGTTSGRYLYIRMTKTN